MRSEGNIAKSISDGEPLDFATINFDDPQVREKYRSFESVALQHIAQRECIFCFSKAYEDDMGMLSDLERIGYSHSPCIEAFYEVGFNFKFIGYIPQIGQYAWEIIQ